MRQTGRFEANEENGRVCKGGKDCNVSGRRSSFPIHNVETLTGFVSLPTDDKDDSDTDFFLFVCLTGLDCAEKEVLKRSFFLFQTPALTFTSVSSPTAFLPLAPTFLTGTFCSVMVSSSSNFVDFSDPVSSLKSLSASDPSEAAFFYKQEAKRSKLGSLKSESASTLTPVFFFGGLYSTPSGRTCTSSIKAVVRPPTVMKLSVAGLPSD